MGDECKSMKSPVAQGLSRKQKGVLVALALLPLLTAAVAQPFLPDTIAAHFGANGVDRWEDKAHLFVPAGIMTVIEFVCIGFEMIYEHLRATNNNDWFVLDDYGGLNPVPFPLMVGVLVLFDAAFMWYVGYNFNLAAGGASVNAPGPGQQVTDVTFVLCVLLLWGIAGYLFVKKGGGLSRVHGHPGATERERVVGDGVRQSRAIGGVLVFLSVVMIGIWAALRFGA